MTEQEIKSLPKKFDFKSNINPLGITYHAVEKEDCYIVTHYDSKWEFTKSEMRKGLLNGDYHLVNEEKPQGIYVIEYGSSYDSDPWEIIGYCETKEEAQEFISKQFHTSLYHCTEVKHISKVKE